MKFNNTQPIFLQIEDWICEQILQQEWQSGARIPSVRDLAVELEVNPNTVMRAYDRLQQSELIVIQRGIGYFLSEQAYEQVLAMRRSYFFEKELPEFIKKMQTLGVKPEEVWRFAALH